MLNRYFSILKKETYALHWISACVDSGLEHFDGVSVEELWEVNEAGNAQVRELKRLSVTEIPEKRPGISLLDVKLEIARRMLDECRFCERRCGVERRSGEKGYCGVGKQSRYSSHFLHMGEEFELVPSHTIFFSGCTFHCVYCQNWDIAMHPESGRLAESGMLSAVLLDGMLHGSKNANFVGGNPDPNLHTIIEIMALADGDAKFLPMVWNSNMYTSLEAMKILEGTIDIFLGDFRYGNDDCAKRLSDVDNYFQVVTRNFKLSFEFSEVMLRHLVLPGHLDCCTLPIMKWVSENIPGVYFNLMFQYRPEYRAPLFPEINRRLTLEERQRAIEIGKEFGINMM